jgi:hypothetical protein
MKTLPIDTAAAWAGTLSTIQDGDPASEASMDLVVDSIGDRLGYLKTNVDGAFLLSSASLRTVSGAGQVVFATSLGVAFDAPATFNGAGSAITLPAGKLLSIDNAARLTCAAGSIASFQGGFGASYETLGDVDSTLGLAYESRVPVLTGNRSYALYAQSTYSALGAPLRKRVSKASTSAHSVTITSPASGTLAVISGGNHQGWVDLVASPSVDGEWRVSAWGGEVSFVGPLV